MNGALTYVVTNVCINCKSQDCIDCCVWEPKCPVDAIKPDIIPNAEKWVALNQRRAKKWPNIDVQGTPLPDADQWADKPVKLEFLSEALAA